MCELGWQSLGVLELTALPSIDEERWVPKVRETDVLLVAGGDALYLCHWMRQSGLADLLPSLHETVWVGLSAGSMVMTPRIGEDFVGWTPPTGSDRTLGIVDFSIFPHLDHEMLPENSMPGETVWKIGTGPESGPRRRPGGHEAESIGRLLAAKTYAREASSYFPNRFGTGVLRTPARPRSTTLPSWTSPGCRTAAERRSRNGHLA
jgi:hypothetical protein